MNLSRLRFLKVCGTALLAPGLDLCPLLAAVAGGLPAAPNPLQSSGPFQLQDATVARLRPLLHTVFTADAIDGRRVTLALARVTERPRGAGVDQFSLVFHARQGSAPLDGMHAFHHAELGAFELFVAPVGAAKPTHIAYEACFSRLVV